MAANEGLREVCAEILEASPYPRRARGAEMLRWAERFEYGEPVPADVHDDAIETAREEWEREFDADITADVDERVAERTAELEARCERLREALVDIGVTVREAAEVTP